MTFRGYLSLMTGGTVLAALCLALAMGATDPWRASWIALVLVYAALFAVSFGLASIIGFCWRFLVRHRELALPAVLVSYRQSFWLAAWLTIVFFLSASRLFSWLNLGILLIIFFSVELFCLSFKRV